MNAASRALWGGAGGLLILCFTHFMAPHGGLTGDFHQTGSLVCSDCHVMHYSETHSVTGGITPVVPLAPGGPFPSLLRARGSEVCLSCHDGRTDAPDVLGANAGAYVRAAGALSRVGDTGEYGESSGHSLGSSNPAPGGTWSAAAGLQCRDCHDIHGNAYYRNLTPNPGGTPTSRFVTYITGLTYTSTAAVQQLVNTPMASHYAATNIRYRQTQVGMTDYGFSEWCSGCHGIYHGIGGTAGMGGSPTGDTNTGSPWLRHPTRDVTMARGVTNKHVDANHWFSTLASRVPVVSPSGIIPGTSGSSDNQVFCGSCHKAHGSNHRAGLIYDDETTAAAEDGTSLMLTCQQCHYQ